MIECTYCKNIFPTRSALNRHQKTAKYCIQLRNVSKLIEPEEYRCDKCNKEFIRKDHYKVHIDNCEVGEKVSKKEMLKQKEREIKILNNEKEKLKEELYECRIKIAELSAKLEKESEIRDEFKQMHAKKDECIEKIAMQPKVTTNTNNTQNNILNQLPPLTITVEQLTEEAEQYFSKELFLKGQVGAADFLSEIVKRQTNGILPWIVSDKARGVFKFKDGNKEIITDIRAERLGTMVCQAIKNKNREHLESFYPERQCESDEEVEVDEEMEENKLRADRSFMELSKMGRDNKVFRKRLMSESSKECNFKVNKSKN